MKCDKFKDSMFQYIDDELSIEDRELFEQHIIDCPECKAYYDKFLKAISALKNMEEVEPPQNTKSLAIKRVKKYRFTNKFKKASAIAAAIVVVVSIYFVFERVMIRDSDGIQNSSYGQGNEINSKSGLKADLQATMVVEKNNSDSDVMPNETSAELTTKSKSPSIKPQNDEVKVNTLMVMYNSNVIDGSKILDKADSLNIEYINRRVSDEDNIVALEFIVKSEVPASEDEGSSLTSLYDFIIENNDTIIYRGNDPVYMNNLDEFSEENDKYLVVVNY